VELLEARTLPSATLLKDTFQTAKNPKGGGWNDVNFSLASRQTGLLSPLTYVESVATGAGGSLDSLTQVNNPFQPNTLRLADEPRAGEGFTFVSLDRDFGADGLSLQQLQVSIDPLGPGSTSAADHWAAIVFGAQPGTSVNGAGTGLLVRSTGEYELWDTSKEIASGNIGSKKSASQSYAIVFTINAATGAFAVSINGKQIATGNHGAYGPNFVTLEDYTGGNVAGTQADYFGNLVVSGANQPPVAAKPNTIYYVSPGGNDSNSGTSPQSPWQTINQVDSVEFRPGDQILFQGGDTFAGDLTFDSQNLGPITISSYGAGTATIDAGTLTGISITNAGQFTITNLDLVGAGYATNLGDGMLITNDMPGVAQTGFTITNVVVSGFGRAGIYFHGVNGSRDFSNVSVTYVSAHDNGDGGFQFVGQGRASDIYIGHVQALHNAGSIRIDSGYGILVSGANDVVIERCVTGDNGWLQPNHGETGGIEAILDNNALIQYNESYGNGVGNSDGDGIILDVTNNSIMQFNYTHDNDGAGLLLYAETNMSSTGNIVRYNISQNDARTQGSTYGGIFVGGDVNDAEIYDNTVFTGPSSASSPSAITLQNVLGDSILVENNIFSAAGGVPVVSSDGSGSDVYFWQNDYWTTDPTPTFLWGGATYQSLSDWSNNTGQEMALGSPSGLNVAPGLNNPGVAGTIGNADRLSTLTSYQLQKDSPLTNAGLDLEYWFGETWDQFSFSTNSFLSHHFSATPTDFYGNVLPPAGSGQFGIGAYQS
jgi:parallel beta helix pectate lyase-like protein